MNDRDPFTTFVEFRRSLMGDRLWLAAGMFVAGLGIAVDQTRGGARIAVLVASVVVLAAGTVGWLARRRPRTHRPRGSKP